MEVKQEEKHYRNCNRLVKTHGSGDFVLGWLQPCMDTPDQREMHQEPALLPDSIAL